MGFLSLM
jgi:hypothetical protein